MLCKRWNTGFRAICGCWLNLSNNHGKKTTRKQPSGRFSYAIRSMMDSTRLKPRPTRSSSSSGRRASENSKFATTSGAGSLLLGALLQVQVTFLQYLFEKRLPELPPTIAQAQADFEKDMATIVRAMSDEVTGKAASAAPDIQQSAARLRQEIEQYYPASDKSIPPTLCDIITLTQNLASIVAPLHADIHATFVKLPSDAMRYRQPILGEA